jgi:formylglycine-generating enzyme required for sulfatase activity
MFTLAGKTAVVTAGCPAPQVVLIPAGAFAMGENSEDRFATDTERPAHRVAIARPFALARFPVTVGEYRAFAPGRASGDDPDLPAVDVSWDEARAYCGWLSAETGESYRLPSESEWEYACRAGSRGPFSCGDEIEPTRANFLYDEQGRRIGPGERSAFGRHPPNAFGLSDMHGNVCEWVEDLWHPTYEGAPADGSPRGGSEAEARRVIRGGAWDYLPRLLRSAWRDCLPRAQRRDNLGFRIARTLG